MVINKSMNDIWKIFYALELKIEYIEKKNRVKSSRTEKLGER